MEEIADFFSNILSMESWPPRWHCGTWSEFHGWLYIFSSLAIWAAYFAIPLSLLYLLRKKNGEFPFVKIFWLFILFILACGLTHLVDVVIFWLPVYRLSALVLFGTALYILDYRACIIQNHTYCLNVKIPATIRRNCSRANKAISNIKP